MITFESQRRAWEKVPVDGQSYHSARQILASSDEALSRTITEMEAIRYDVHGNRNHKNLWREGMGLDTLHGRVLDYGCGIGMEALQYARSGNTVSVADINSSTVRLAARVLRLYDYNPARCLLIRNAPAPLTDAPDGEFHLVVMNGVLHHIPDPLPTVQEAYRLLKPAGELRLMLYTDEGWRVATETEPPQDVATDPMRERFVHYFDQTGDWADWYNADRLRERFGDWFDVAETRYITPDGRYMTAVLVKR